MKSPTWNYYCTLKPMFILLSVTGLFNVYKNPHASTLLRMLTVSNCAVRLMWNLSLVSLTLSLVFIDGTTSIETHLQGIIFSVYYMANVTFIMVFNFHPKSVKLLTEIKSQSEAELKRTFRTFVWLSIVYLTCIFNMTYFKVTLLFDESARIKCVQLFYPFKDPNSFVTYMFLVSDVVFMSPGECIIIMYYSYLCVLMRNKYKYFNEQMKSIHKEVNSPMAHVSLELYRSKYKYIQNIVSQFNSIFSIFIAFNLTLWLLMICAIAYITAIVEYTAQLFCYSIQLSVMLFVVCLTSSMVQHEVGIPFLSLHITSNCRHFGRPIIHTDIYSQCYFVH